MKLLRHPLLPWSLLGLCLLGFGVVALRSGDSSVAGTTAAALDSVAGAPTAAIRLQPATVPAKSAAAAATEAAASASAMPVEAVRLKVQGSAAATFARELGRQDGDKISAAWARLFVWDVDLRRGIHAGDEVAALWTWDENELPIALAASLRSKGSNTALKAYRFQAPGDAFASYWTAEGVEVPRRLVGGPIEGYEQITSLLKDRPTHGGIDFKAPVGTPVTAPRDGVVTRINWNWKANGNCMEVQLADGTVAKFLHLSKNLLKEGDNVKQGQTLAESGNTGYSTAPHLHYQLEQGGKVIDPIDYHGVERRKLEGEGLAGLQAAAAEFDRKLAGVQVAAN